MATIQVRDVPDEVAAILRRLARAAGQSLQAYMREQLVELAYWQDRSETMKVMRETLERDPDQGATRTSILADLRLLHDA